MHLILRKIIQRDTCWIFLAGRESFVFSLLAISATLLWKKEKLKRKLLELLLWGLLLICFLPAGKASREQLIMLYLILDINVFKYLKYSSSVFRNENRGDHPFCLWLRTQPPIALLLYLVRLVECSDSCWTLASNRFQICIFLWLESKLNFATYPYQTNKHLLVVATKTKTY